MLTKLEQREAKKYASGVWAIFRYEAETGITTWVKRESPSIIKFIETQDSTQIVEENAYLRTNWDGWQGRKHGAVVARIPIVTDNALKIRCGYDGAEYDKKKYNELLNDIDYRKLRTGGGSL